MACRREEELTDFLLSALGAGETGCDTEANFEVGRYNLLFLSSAASSSAEEDTITRG